MLGARLCTPLFTVLLAPKEGGAVLRTIAWPEDSFSFRSGALYRVVSIRIIALTRRVAGALSGASQLDGGRGL